VLRSGAATALLFIGGVIALHPTPSDAQPSSGIRAWHGIGVREGPDCDCCGLVFPDGFGANDAAQLELLRELAGSQGRAKELRCFAYKRAALQHLTALATKRQDRSAALIILRADSEQGVDLGGGELSETVGSEFMVHVLLGFKAVKSLLEPGLTKHVAGKVCASAMTVGEVDIAQLAKRLRAQALSGLAKTIEQTCAAMTRGEG